MKRLPKQSRRTRIRLSQEAGKGARTRVRLRQPESEEETDRIEVLDGIGYTTIYNRFNRWSRQGIWTDIFYALTGSTGQIGTMSIDSTHIKAHRSAAGAKGGTSSRRLAARAADARPKSTC